jgi:hypothetical protein
MYASFEFHDEATLSYMVDGLCCFHSIQDVSLLGRAGTVAKAKARTLTMDLVKKRMVDAETNAETWTPSKMRCEMNAWGDYISHEIDVSKESNADCNFPKIHLMSHWVEQIPQYGAFPQYSAKLNEKEHKTISRTKGMPPLTIASMCRM